MILNMILNMVTINLMVSQVIIINFMHITTHFINIYKNQPKSLKDYFIEHHYHFILDLYSRCSWTYSSVLQGMTSSNQG